MSSPLRLTLERIHELKALINRVLDQDFEDTVRPTLRRIDASVNDGEIADALNALDAAVEDIEAKQADTNERRLLPTNPAVLSLLFMLAATQRRNAQAINAVASDVQGLGVNAGITLTRQLAMLGIDTMPWNVARPDVILAAANIINRPAFTQSLNNFMNYPIQLVRETILTGMIQGNGARTIARRVRQLVTTLPRSNAESLLRSVQLDAYRTSSSANMLANSNVLEGHMRIAVLDDRTCLACIAEHGRMLGLDEKVIDHRAGRCTSIPIVRNRPVVIQSGQEWLDTQTPQRRISIMGEGNANAYEAGAVQLQDFVHRTTDPLFGEVITQMSLSGILGPQAEQYYARNRR